LVSFLYDQELTYTVDNPDGGALFLSRVQQPTDKGVTIK